MSRSFRRFEFLLPLRFSDGQAVPNELIAQALLELEQRFGAVTSETQVLQGYWQQQGNRTVTSCFGYLSTYPTYLNTSSSSLS